MRLLLCVLSVAVAAMIQYTPDQADWSSLNQKALAGSNTGHDPDGISWISVSQWESWDGTVYDPSKMSKSEFKEALCPGTGDRIRGLRDLFYQHNPFADNKNPTKAEVDHWHTLAINHIRAMVGYTEPERQVEPDICMFARALWGDERKFTRMWDCQYGGNLGSAPGPCVGMTNGNSHCGASFVPSAADQARYLPNGASACGTPGGAEGISSAPKSNIPWSIKFSRAFCGYVGSEGFWGGHTGPWFHRQKFGFSFWDNDPSNNNNNAVLRAKWTGTLMPSKYTNPNNKRSEETTQEDDLKRSVAARVTNCADSVAQSSDAEMTISFGSNSVNVTAIKRILEHLTKVTSGLTVTKSGSDVTIRIQDSAASSAINMIADRVRRNSDFFQLRDSSVGSATNVAVRGTNNLASVAQGSLILIFAVISIACLLF